MTMEIKVGDSIKRLHDLGQTFRKDVVYRVKEVSLTNEEVKVFGIDGVYDLTKFEKIDAVDAIEQKRKELKQLIEARDKKLIEEANAKGFFVGANVRRGGLYTIDSLFVVDSENYRKHSASITSAYSKENPVFVAIKAGASSFPVANTTLLDPVPEIHGYKMSPYVKGSGCVVFGCARISVSLLKAIRDNNTHAVNRHVALIELASGKTLNSKQIEEILNYIKE